MCDLASLFEFPKMDIVRTRPTRRFRLRFSSLVSELTSRSRRCLVISLCPSGQGVIVELDLPPRANTAAPWCVSSSASGLPPSQPRIGC